MNERKSDRYEESIGGVGIPQNKEIHSPHQLLRRLKMLPSDASAVDVEPELAPPVSNEIASLFALNLKVLPRKPKGRNVFEVKVVLGQLLRDTFFHPLVSADAERK